MIKKYIKRLFEFIPEFIPLYFYVLGVILGRWGHHNLLVCISVTCVFICMIFVYMEFLNEKERS